MTAKIDFIKLQDGDTARSCANMMTSSEPWLTLKISFQDALQNLTDPLHETYLAMIEGQIAGFIILQLRGAFTGYVKTIIVHPDWRNQGIGTQLLQFAENQIFTEKPNVFLCVSSFNKKAQKFYRRLGYKKVGVLKNYIVAGHAEILLRKTTGPISTFKKSSV